MENLTTPVDIYDAILTTVWGAGFPGYLTSTYPDGFGEIAEDYENGRLSLKDALEEAVELARDIYNDPEFEGDTSAHDQLMQALDRVAPGRFRTSDG
jgi:hypothetical protein